MRLDSDFIKSLLKWLLKGIFFSAGVLLVLVVLYVAGFASLFYESFHKCGNRVLVNEQEAIGALKYALMSDRRYDEIFITSPPSIISTEESDSYNLPDGWKISVRLMLKEKITVEEIYVTRCAELY